MLFKFWLNNTYRIAFGKKQKVKETCNMGTRRKFEPVKTL